MAFLETKARSFALNVMEMQYEITEKTLGDKSVKKGELFEATRHYRNALDVHIGNISFLKKEWKDNYKSRLFPIVLLWKREFDQMIRPAPKAMRTSQALDHGRLALIYQELGRNREAEQEWNIALDLATDRSPSELRDLVRRGYKMLRPNQADEPDVKN